MFIVSDVATATNVTRCFTCQSPGNPECEDEFDRTVGSSISCSSLSYGRSVDIPDLIQNVLVHERASNTTVFSFYCVKLGVRYTSKDVNYKIQKLSLIIIMIFVLGFYSNSIDPN